MFNEYPPIGLAYIGAILRKNDFEVSILDMTPMDVPYKMLSNHMKDVDIVGITCMTENFDETLKVAEIAKQLKKTVIVGGPHVSMMTKEVLSNQNIDYGVIGEGEVTIIELLQWLQEKSTRKEASEIKGIAFKNNDGKIVITPPRQLITDIDSLPYPAYDLLPPLNKYFAPQVKNFPLGALMSSRGCPFGCVFCSKSIFGKSFRQHSTERIIEDIRRLVETHGAKEIHILDDAFNTNIKHAKEVFKLLVKNKIKCTLYFPAGLRIDNIDEEFLHLLRQAGGYGLNVGVETGNKVVMADINKHLSLDTVKKTAKLIMDNNFLLSTNFMIGHITDTPDTIEETVQFAIKLNPHFAGFQLTTIYRDTELYKQAYAKGITENNNQSGLEYCIPPCFTLEKLKKIRKKAMLRFMLRWSYLPRLIFALKTFKWYFLIKGTFRLFLLRFLSTWASR